MTKEVQQESPSLGEVQVRVPARNLETVAATKEREVSSRVHIEPKDLERLAELFLQIEVDALVAARPKIEAYVSREFAHRNSDDRSLLIAEKIEQEQERLAAKWEVQLRDKTKLGPMMLEDVLLIPNNFQRRIEQIKIENGYGESRASVTIRRGGFRPVFEYSLKGQHSLVQKFSNKLDEFIETIQPVGHWLYSMPLSGWFLLPFTGLLIGLFGDSAIEAAKTQSYGRLILLLLLMGLIPLLLFGKRFLFPKCEIAIGKEVDRLALLGKARWAVLTLTVGTVIAVARETL
jgi:hypothetical protein